MSYRVRIAALPIAAAALAAATPAAAGDRGWDRASTVARDVLVVAALGVPAVQGDWTGDLQAGASLIVAEGASWGLKQAFPERRPDGRGDDSFPSGHTALAFAAAATMENRYGWKAGLPALAVATLVGVGRIEARRHHWYDVVAGAAIGTGSGLLLTRKRTADVRLVPWGDSRGGGLAMGYRF